jgi:FG-GAP-like repeat/FG-GAP repeat
MPMNPWWKKPARTPRATTRRFRPACLRLEDRTVPTIIAFGSGPGQAPEVKVFDTTTGAYTFDFNAYDAAFQGGVRVAVGDVNGDGTPDIVTGAGPGGGPHVKVFNAVDLSLMQSFFAYDAGFTGGVTVATGDFNGDGIDDIVTGAGPGGGPHVKVFDGTNLALLQSFFAYSDQFHGGVFVAAGDFNGDGLPDIVTGAGAGGGPQVIVYDGQTLAPLQSFFAYDLNFTGGVRVAAMDLQNNGTTELFTAPGAGNSPLVKLFRNGQPDPNLPSIQVFDSSFTSGVDIG